MPRKVFVAGEILTAADVNTNLMDQSVMVFAGTAARGSAIPSPSEGMVTYLSDSDEVEVFDGSAYKAVGPGKILQVVQGSTTTPTSTTSGTYQASGVSVSITPSSTSSKIILVVNISIQVAATPGGSSEMYLGLFRDSTNIKESIFGLITSGVSANPLSFDTAATLSILDTPATTSAIDYNVQYRTDGLANRTARVQYNSDLGTIVAMEVAG